MHFSLFHVSLGILPIKLPEKTGIYTYGISNSKNQITITLKLNKGVFKGTIVALPGWNYAALDWCSKTSPYEAATKEGYCVVLVETYLCNKKCTAH